MKFIHISLLAASMLLASACSHEKTKEELAAHPEEAPPVTKAQPKAESSIEAKEVAAEEEAAQVTELRFQKGKSNLTPEAKDKLKHLYTSATTIGKIIDIKAVTWADSEYPSAKTKKLTRRQIKLAGARNSAIRDYIQGLDKDLTVEVYNMAEQPGTFEKFFGGEEAQIKKSLESAGIPHSDSKLKSSAKASRSIVMAKIKNPKPL